MTSTEVVRNVLKINGMTRGGAGFDRNPRQACCSFAWFMDLADVTTFDLVDLDEAVDRSLPVKEHPDFNLPRTMKLVHLAGAGLKLGWWSVEP